ncbi:MAG TPA: hypothetical protein DHV49_05555, partial [Alphaproteobacteria bacterium]|nr:hypothetical protein [Alphaproteobacteria bacterium]
KQVIIDAFFISQRRTENAVVGIDLVSKLQAQLGATLVDYNSESNNSDITKIISRSRFLRLQDISIALSLANDGNSAGAIQSSLSISSTLGKPAELFAGGEVFIIASTDSDSAQFKEDIGLNITVTPTVIATDKVVMTVQAENDTIVGNTALPSFQYLTTRKLSTKTAATMNYSVPAIVSNFSSDELLSEESGQTGLREIPLLEFITSERSKLYVQRENVLMLFVRPGWDNGQSNYKFNAQQNIARRLGLGALENIKPKNIPLPYPQAIFSKY